MTVDKKSNLFFLIAIALISAVNFAGAVAVSPDLKSSIDKKSQELNEVNTQIQNIQNQLDETRSQKQSLQKELKQINGNINQINLSIKSSKVAVEKLSLQVEDTQYKIQNSESKINEKEAVITELLRQIQKKDSLNNPLLVILNNKSIAEGLSEVQRMVNFQDNLSYEVLELKNLKDDLQKNLDIASDHKKQKEIENKNFENKKIIAEELKKYRQTVLEQTKNKEANYQQSLSELQKRQEQIAAEIEELDAQMRGKIDLNVLPTSHPGVLAMPIQGKISQDYGATDFARHGGYRGKWHNGIDISAPIGTPVYAAEAGEVLAVGNQDRYCYKGAYGKFIVIRHNNNLATLYSHFSLQIVKEGQKVNRGDLIGYVGNTGYSTGPHLHFTVYAGPTLRISPAKTCGPKMPYGGDLNPFNYL
ncbi:MAG: peptidoglycan DD-metalloendopeptidase family protein [Patescibacteria group bacterium]|nr:peptidoglycan DD-metalloendopeptidase family protein [Patescibacteria group bacterium]